MNDQELQNLKATVARLETAIEMTTRGERVSLAGARRQQRRALWFGTLGLCALPVVGWAAVELTTFQKGDMISSADVNANFEALAAVVNASPVQRLCAISSTGVEGCEWVADVTDTGAGTWEVAFAAASFPSEPTCVCTAPQTGVWCDTIDIDDASVVVETMNAAAQPYDTDLGFRIICASDP